VRTLQTYGKIRWSRSTAAKQLIIFGHGAWEKHLLFKSYTKYAYIPDGSKIIYYTVHGNFSTSAQIKMKQIMESPSQSKHGYYVLGELNRIEQSIQQLQQHGEGDPVMLKMAFKALTESKKQLQGTSVYIMTGPGYTYDYSVSQIGPSGRDSAIEENFIKCHLVAPDAMDICIPDGDKDVHLSEFISITQGIRGRYYKVYHYLPCRVVQKVL